jgi:hypothetical protein
MFEGQLGKDMMIKQGVCTLGLLNAYRTCRSNDLDRDKRWSRPLCWLSC